ncbi:methionine aminopeptidase 1D, mitochondrial-like [Glossina fuscipes fuscipes]
MILNNSTGVCVHVRISFACHGIPDDRCLMDGDIVNVDISVYYGGYHGYCSKTPLVGNVDEEGCYLVKTTEECLNDCISLCRPNVEFNAVILHHNIDKKSIAFAITKQQSKRVIPILTFGGPEVEIEKNGWAATTLDGARTAQFDHTILITETGAEVLTKPS